MWKNWSGYVSSDRAALHTPATHEALKQVLSEANRREASVRMVGAGHSFSPLVQTDDIMLSLDKLQGVIGIDRAKMEAHVHAGTRLYTLGQALASHGVAMENLGDINAQSVAGATSTGTHGTGIGLGNISTQITRLKLITADGSEIIGSPDNNPELYEAGRIGLGVLGVVTEIGLRVVPSFRLRLERAAMSLDECLARQQELTSKHRSFEFFWFPHTDTVLTKAWNATDAPITTRGWTSRCAESFLENTVFGFLCSLGRRFPASCPSMSRLCASAISPSSQVDASHAMLATSRRVRFNEMEWALPAERGADAMREIRSFIDARHFPLMFPIEYRWVRGDDIWLSPNYERDSAHISVHQYRGMPFERYFDGIQAICLNHGGRPHWGKVHALTAKQFERLYPRWDDFRALRERMDPQGRFLSPYMRRILGV